jgi:hypothetical protein
MNKIARLIEEIGERSVSIIFILLGVFSYFIFDKRISGITAICLIVFGLGILVGQEIKKS